MPLRHQPGENLDRQEGRILVTGQSGQEVVTCPIWIMENPRSAEDSPSLIPTSTGHQWGLGGQISPKESRANFGSLGCLARPVE